MSGENALKRDRFMLTRETRGAEECLVTNGMIKTSMIAATRAGAHRLQRYCLPSLWYSFSDFMWIFLLRSISIAFTTALAPVIVVVNGTRY